MFHYLFWMIGNENLKHRKTPLLLKYHKHVGDGFSRNNFITYNSIPQHIILKMLNYTW